MFISILLPALVVLWKIPTGDASFLPDAANCFTLNLYKQLATPQNNLISSPFSADIVLSLLLQGAGGNTAKQLKTVLGYDNLITPQTYVKNAFKSAMASLTSSTGSTLDIANSIWLQNSLALKPDFFNTASDYFNAYVDNSLEFMGNPINATNTINKWGETNTNGLIPKIFDETLPRNTLMVLANAIYFKGQWTKKFDPKNTFPQTFYNVGDPDVKNSVPFMNQEQRFPYKYNSDLEAQILEMDYIGNETSMVVILPDATSGLVTLVQKLNCGNFKNSYQSLPETVVDLTFPKFTIESSLDLKNPLKNLGATDMFNLSGGADLSGMLSTQSATKIAVGDVVQKAVVKVDEDGSEAAAVTAARVCRSCATAVRINPSFRANKPFLYFIRHKPTGLLLFIGQLNSL